MENLAKRIEALRAGFLFDEEGHEEGLGPFSEQQYLLALGHLEMAARFMKMAAYYRARRE